MIKRIIQTDLAFIAREGEEKEDENWSFRSYLKGKDPDKIDKIVHQLNKEVSEKIDCTTCGNCCKVFMINITNDEVEKFAAFMKEPVDVVKEKYIETSDEGENIVNKMPCHFLECNKCTIYEQRFTECREFPHLYKPGFTSRLFGVLYNYGVCPIVYNVVEQLKDELHYRR